MRLLFAGLLSVVVIGCQNGSDDEAERATRSQEMPMGEVMMGEGMMGGGMMGEGMMGGGMMDEDMMQHMRVIHSLLVNHEQIRREVTEIPNGVVTVTTSRDPELAALIRTHVHQMNERIEEGRMIRHMDPLFREIFAHHDKIEMTIEEVPGGVRVRETSSDPRVALLIKQHAQRAISEFVERGMPRAMEPTPLPEGYSRGE